MNSNMDPVLIIDTDVGSDDALAVLLALKHPNVTILAITTVHGNVDIEQASSNILRILHLCQKTQIPVYKGCSYPLLFPRESDNYHGKDGLSGAATDFPLPNISVQEEHAPCALVRYAKENPGRITLITLGPLTNVAIAHRLDPTFSANLKEIIIMGGNCEGKGNVTPCTEFNFFCDPEAANITLREFKCSKTIVPWEVCMKHTYKWDWYDKWISKNTTLSNFVSKVTRSAAEFSRNTTKRSGYHCCDLLAMTAVLVPSTVTKQEAHFVEVEVHGLLTRGQMIVDWRTHITTTPNAKIVLEMDSQRIQTIWEELTD